VIAEHRFEGAEVPLNVAEGAPSGPPIVFFHGVLRCWQDFTPLIPHVEAKRRVVAPDHRGHGGSGRAAGYRVVDYTRDAAAFVRGALDAPAVVFGHSLGAMVAAAVAAEVPERVLAIVMEDPPFETMGARIRQTPFHEYFTAVQRVAAAGGEVEAMAEALGRIEMTGPTGARVRLAEVRDAESLRFSARCLTRIDPRVLEPIVEGRWLEGYERDAIMRRVQCPALLIQGDASAGGMLPDADGRRVTELMPKGCRVRLSGVGHLIHQTQPDAVARLVNAFLESLP
jgi:pimeloyl-ACP methyl ester carboxylesterase